MDPRTDQSARIGRQVSDQAIDRRSSHDAHQSFRANDWQIHMPLRIGLISDTHGLLRPEAISFLRDCDHIIHGGDIGKASVLDALSEIAPVTAVRGNNDKGAWADALAETEIVRLGEVYIYAVHDIGQLDIDAVAARIQVVVSGHSHVPGMREKDGILYINPGSAGPRRFRLPIAVGELLVSGSTVTPRIVELECK